MVTSAGRLKSPAIDFDHGNSSIGGDFNHPADFNSFRFYQNTHFMHQIYANHHYKRAYITQSIVMF
jgi:hypothetical protein